MLSVNDVFYNNSEDPVRILGSTYGHGSRSQYRDGREEYSSNSSRYQHQHSRGRDGGYHNGGYHSRNSLSPPRERESITGLHIRDRLFGSRNSLSPPRSRHAYDQHGYNSRSRDAYSPPGRRHDSHHSRSVGTYASGYASSDVYHGEHTATVPRTYQSANYYNAYGNTTSYGQTIKLKVPLCCEACEERITNHLLDLEGVQTVTCDQVRQKVTVTGVADPSEVLRASKECFKHSKFWRG